MEEVNEEHLEKARAAEVAQGPEGLLFTGNAIRALSVAQLTSIGEFASRMFGVEMRPVHNVQRELGGAAVVAEAAEPEPEPIRVDRDRAFKWAKRQHYSEPKMRHVLNVFNLTKNDYAEYDPTPDLCHDGTENDDPDGWRGYPDLRSVYERLRRTNMSSQAWRVLPGYKVDIKHPTEQEMRVMVDYINWAVEPRRAAGFCRCTGDAIPVDFDKRSWASPINHKTLPPS